jgi:hypothetical protein
VQQPGNAQRPHRRAAQLQELAQRHGEDGHIHGVRRGVLIELLELEQREHHGLFGMHRY